MTKKTEKFRIKILKYFLFGTIIPILIVSISTLFLLFKTRQQNIFELQNLALETADEKVTKALKEKMEGFNLVISGINDLNELDQDNIAFLLNSVKNTSKGANRIGFYSLDGTEIAEIDKINTIRINYDEINNQKNSSSSLRSFNKLARKNIKTREDFEKAVTGKDYISSIIKNEEQNIIRLASQIENQNRNIIGVVSAELDLNSLNQLNDTHLAESGFVYVLDNNNKIVTSSKISPYRPDQNLGDQNILNQAEQGKLASGYHVYKNKYGQKMISLGRKMNQLDWLVISEWPREDAFQVINNIIFLLIIITFLTILAVFALSYAFAKKIVKPIKILSKGAKQISKGNLDHQIELKTNDEFELLGRQFTEMTKVLKENKRLRNEFIYIATHELRTPVTAIKGYISLLQENKAEKLPPEAAKNIDTINEINERLINLVHNILEIARSDAGKMKITLEPINIEKSVQDVITELDSLAQEKNINIIYKPVEKNTMVLADQQKLEEVLTNIIGNAIKYTLQENDINIYHETNDNFLITNIQDGGIGIEEDEAKKLFTKFQRVYNRETADVEGTGLGLYICKEIINRMGGKIWLKSKKGQGSTFSFSLKTK